MNGVSGKASAPRTGCEPWTWGSEMAALTLEELPDGRTEAPRLRPGTIRRVLRYLQPQRRGLSALIAVIVVDALLAVALPLSTTQDDR